MSTSPAPASSEWWAQLAVPPGTGRGRPPVEIDRIVAAGLAVIDAGESSELSIRNVAGRLGSSTATLYRRVGGRLGLDALIVDSVLGEAGMALDTSDESTWQAACIADADAVFLALARHPRSVALLAARVPTGPNASRLRERFVGRLLREGFSIDLAARTYTTIAHYTVGFGLQLQFEAGDGTPGSSLPAASAAPEFLESDLRSEFLFGLRMLTAGIAGSTDLHG